MLPDAEMIDHRDGNGLNNRHTNLRPATDSQNQANKRKPKNGVTPSFKGVFWHGRDMKWAARIRVNGKRKYLGYFHSEVEAARAYDAVALLHFGEFAKLNFPLEQKAA